MAALALGIDLGGGNSKRSFNQRGVKRLQFVSQGFKDDERVLVYPFSDINQIEQQGGSLDMFEELMPRPLPS